MDKIARPVGVVLIALVNLVIYIAVLAYAFNLRSTPVYAPVGGPVGVLVAMIFVVCVAYSIVGISGVIGLLARWRSFRELAMIGWAIECLPFSIIGIIEVYFFSQALLEEGFRLADWQLPQFRVMLTAVAVVLFKITSIVYFAKKKT